MFRIWNYAAARGPAEHDEWVGGMMMRRTPWNAEIWFTGIVGAVCRGAHGRSESR